MDRLSIGEVAGRAGVETSTIRYYERVGLLPRPGRENGRRFYRADVLKRLALIKSTQAAGFTIAEMITLMSAWEAEGRSPKEWRQFIERKLAQIEESMRQAERTKQILVSALACGCLDHADVPLDQFVASSEGGRFG